MPPLLDHGSLLEHDDPRGIAYRAYPVRRDERRSPRQGFAQRAENLRFGVRVDSRQRVVEQHNTRLFCERSRKRGALLLTTGQIDPPLAEDRLVAAGKLVDRLMELRDARRPFSGLCNAARSVREVRSDGVAEEKTLLRHESDVFPQLRRHDVLRRNAVDENLAFLRIVHSRNQIDERALPASGRTDHAERCSRGDVEADVAQHPARLARGVRRIVKSDVPELDGAARFGRRQMLARLFTVDGRSNLEDLRQTSHRSIAPLKQVDDPAERDHRPGEHGEIHAERDERANGNRALDRQRSADSENDDRAQSPEEREQWIQRSPQPHQRHVEREVLIVDRAEARHLGRFLPVSADDPCSGEILLRSRGERREMLLHRLEPIVDRLSHFDREHRQEERRQEGEQRELDVDAEHEVQREQAARDRIGEVHHGGADRHSNRAQVVGEARHDVASAGLCKVRRVQRLQMLEEVVAQVVLHPAADAVHQLAHPVSERAADDGGEDDDAAELPDVAHRRARADGVDCASQHPRDHAGDCRRRQDDQEARCKGDPVRFVVWRSDPEILHVWHVDCRPYVLMSLVKTKRSSHDGGGFNGSIYSPV